MDIRNKKRAAALWAVCLAPMAGSALAQQGGQAQVQAQPRAVQARPFVQDPSSKARFDELDANHDGRIDSDEFLAKKKAEWVKFSDGASMGVASCVAAESEPMRAGGADAASLASFGVQAKGGCSRLDKKRDGKITWTEFAGQSWGYFKLLDLDHDGFLSPAEFGDQGISALRSGPKPNPSPAIQARMAADLAKAKSAHKTIRTAAEVAAQPVGAAPAGGQAPAPAAVSERIGNWLK